MALVMLDRVIVILIWTARRGLNVEEITAKTSILMLIDLLTAANQVCKGKKLNV